MRRTAVSLYPFLTVWPRTSLLGPQLLICTMRGLSALPTSLWLDHLVTENFFLLSAPCEGHQMLAPFPTPTFHQLSSKNPNRSLWDLYAPSLPPSSPESDSMDYLTSPGWFPLNKNKSLLTVPSCASATSFLSTAKHLRSKGPSVFSWKIKLE